MPARMLAMFPQRVRLPLIIVASVVVLVGVGLLVWALSNPEGVRHSGAQPGEPSVTPTLTAEPVKPVLRPGEIVATIKGEEVQVFDAPGGKRTHTLDKWSEATFATLTLLTVEKQDVNGEEWLRVMLPMQPNQSTGWIKASEVTTTTTKARIDIYIAERELELWDGEELILTAPVALGAPETPTPPGLYSITDPLDTTHNMTGVYGAFALGLSGFSEVLKTFDGAPPQLAIHGTNTPDLIGQYVSNGCIRMYNEDILTVVDHTNLGTPVHIYASRAAAAAELAA